MAEQEQNFDTKIHIMTLARSVIVIMTTRIHTLLNLQERVHTTYPLKFKCLYVS